MNSTGRFSSAVRETTPCRRPVRLRTFVGVFAIGWFLPSICCVYVERGQVGPVVQSSDPAKGDAPAPTANVAKASETDPEALLARAAQRYEREVKSYRCMFWKQELVNNAMTARQGIEVVYRERPHSIKMIWRHNPNRIRRALYVDGVNVSGDGEPCVMVEPNNPLLRLCASKVSIPIHSERARSTSRYPLDQFGIRATLARIREVNRRAAAAGVLDLKIVGNGIVDHRPTIVLERRLPYSGPDGTWPDSRLVIHLDRELLYPVAVHAYADPAGQVLLGSYVLTDLKLNPQLDDETFKL